jgi:hypothetical protein
VTTKVSTELSVGAALVGGVAVLADASTIAVNAALGNHFRVTLGGARTLGNPSNPADGQKITVEVIQPASGGPWTLAYGSAYAFGTDIPSPTLTTTASKRDFLAFIYSASASLWYLTGCLHGF